MACKIAKVLQTNPGSENRSNAEKGTLPYQKPALPQIKMEKGYGERHAANPRHRPQYNNNNNFKTRFPNVGGQTEHPGAKQ